MQYNSDPVSLAVADAVLTVIEEELQANAKEVGDYLMERLRVLVDKHNCLGDVRYADQPTYMYHVLITH